MQLAWIGVEEICDFLTYILTEGRSQFVAKNKNLFQASGHEMFETRGHFSNRFNLIFRNLDKRWI